jgi:hypothetical protein
MVSLKLKLIKRFTELLMNGGFYVLLTIPVLQIGNQKLLRLLVLNLVGVQQKLLLLNNKENKKRQLLLRKKLFKFNQCLFNHNQQKIVNMILIINSMELIGNVIAKKDFNKVLLIFQLKRHLSM